MVEVHDTHSENDSSYYITWRGDIVPEHVPLQYQNAINDYDNIKQLIEVQLPNNDVCIIRYALLYENEDVKKYDIDISSKYREKDVIALNIVSTINFFKTFPMEIHIAFYGDNSIIVSSTVRYIHDLVSKSIEGSDYNVSLCTLNHLLIIKIGGERKPCDEGRI